MSGLLAKDHGVRAEACKQKKPWMLQGNVFALSVPGGGPLSASLCPLSSCGTRGHMAVLAPQAACSHYNKVPAGHKSSSSSKSSSAWEGKACCNKVPPWKLRLLDRNPPWLYLFSVPPCCKQSLKSHNPEPGVTGLQRADRLQSKDDAGTPRTSSS